jgi:large exoprotein involved in heme utilization and adhesion
MRNSCLLNTRLLNTKKLSAMPSRHKLYIAIFATTQIMAGQVFAAPEGGQVVGGAGSINQAGTQTTIHQETQRMAIDWQSFNVKADERVQFIQPNSNSVALNRVLSNRVQANSSPLRRRRLGGGLSFPSTKGVTEGFFRACA